VKEVGHEKVAALYDKAVQFNSGINLYEKVEKSEWFFIGDQWRGINTNNNPSPVFNFMKRVTLFQVAKICSDSFAIQTAPLSVTMDHDMKELEHICDVVNRQFDRLIEKNKLVSKMREFVRNAAVDGDACLHSWFDPTIKTGQTAKGEIVTEVVENTRVLFGNPTVRDVQQQPYIIIPMRWEVEKAKRIARANGEKTDDIRADNEENASEYDRMTDNKVTVLLYYAMDYETNTIWAGKYTKDGVIEKLKDTKLERYPIVWMNWDYVLDCYHGCSLIEQLIHNQIFLNRGYAMVMRSMMTSAFPKYVYNKNLISFWDSGIGKAIGVTGGELNNVAKIIEPAPISPQVAQFLELVMDTTQNLMGASDAALGDTRPDNTSAIIALQRASDAPLELVRQNMYQALEDLANIYQDMMRVYYGSRYVMASPFTKEQLAQPPLGMMLNDNTMVVNFDFSVLEQIPLSLSVNVGASSYWSEIAMAQTLDNLLMQNKIDIVDYLERIPEGRILRRQELIDKLKGMMAQPPMTGGGPITPEEEIEVSGGGGYSQLARSLNETGVA